MPGSSESSSLGDVLLQRRELLCCDVASCLAKRYLVVKLGRFLGMLYGCISKLNTRNMRWFLVVVGAPPVNVIGITWPWIKQLLKAERVSVKSSRSWKHWTTMNNFSFGCLRLSHVCKQCITNTTNLNERVKTQPNKPNQSNSSPKGILTQLAKIKLTSHTSRITKALILKCFIKTPQVYKGASIRSKNIWVKRKPSRPGRGDDEPVCTRKYIRKINGWLDEIPFWDFCYFTGAMAMLVSGSYSLPLPFLFLKYKEQFSVSVVFGKWE